ncbi:hypothetical protein I020019A2_14860 [Bifidobacterium pseudocatenulatum]|nr:hypothetical protein MCC01992_12310 [Bifidobacteriaceae bacterium MCC01992]
MQKFLKTKDTSDISKKTLFLFDALKKQLLNKAANFYNVSPEQDIEQMQRERLQSFVS